MKILMTKLSILCTHPAKNIGTPHFICCDRFFSVMGLLSRKMMINRTTKKGTLIETLIYSYTSEMPASYF